MQATEAELSGTQSSDESTGEALLKHTFEMIERALISGVLLATANYLLKHPDANPKMDQFAATGLLLLGFVLMTGNVGAYLGRLRKLGLPKVAWVPVSLIVITISAALISVAVRSNPGG